MEHSKTNLYYLDSTTNKKIIPYVIEPSVGVERLFYAIICDKYEIEKLENNETREILHLPFALSPYKFAVLPLVNKLNDKAKEIYQKLVSKGIAINFDASGSIGKRYRRQDAIGTFYCLTIDFTTCEDNTITIRERDSMKQKRIKIEDIDQYIVN
jgi:glycyl-tRNA synthetase